MGILTGALRGMVNEEEWLWRVRNVPILLASIHCILWKQICAVSKDNDDDFLFNYHPLMRYLMDIILLRNFPRGIHAAILLALTSRTTDTTWNFWRCSYHFAVDRAQIYSPGTMRHPTERQERLQNQKERKKTLELLTHSILAPSGVVWARANEGGWTVTRKIYVQRPLTVCLFSGQSVETSLIVIYWRQSYLASTRLLLFRHCWPQEWSPMDIVGKRERCGSLMWQHISDTPDKYTVLFTIHCEISVSVTSSYWTFKMLFLH